jgi:hypothetical protein
MSVYENTFAYDKGEILLKIEYDEDPISPDEMGDCEPTFFHADRGYDLRRKLDTEFGDNAQIAYWAMASGDVYKTKEKDWYFGFTEYRHSGSAFALCRSTRARNFPDQQWDMIGLAGWIKITRQNRVDWGIHGRKGVEEKARGQAKNHLETWEAYVNGQVFGYVVEVYPYTDEGEVEDVPADTDSCWGFYGEEYAKEEACAAIGYLVHNLGWTETFVKFIVTAGE